MPKCPRIYYLGRRLSLERSNQSDLLHVSHVITKFRVERYLCLVRILDGGFRWYVRTRVIVQLSNDIFNSSVFRGMGDVLWLSMVLRDVLSRNQPGATLAPLGGIFEGQKQNGRQICQGQIWFFNKWSQEQVWYLIFMWFWLGNPFLLLF